MGPNFHTSEIFCPLLAVLIMWGDGNWAAWVVGVKDLGLGHVDVMTILGGLGSVIRIPQVWSCEVTAIGWIG